MDLAIIEAKGNGGDLILNGNDLSLVSGIENMPYLGMFGGNPKQSTQDNIVLEQSFDWWGNSLLMRSNQSIQFNSLTERIINSTPLSSSGRVIIENALKKDLEFISPLATVTVSVTIVSDDRINVAIRIAQNDGTKKITIINFRKLDNGDFFFEDFNDDFYL